MALSDPVFFGAGHAFYEGSGDADATQMQVIYAVTKYLDTLIGDDHNGEALIIGTTGQKQVLGVYRLATHTGWPVRVLTNSTLSGSGGAAALDTVFAEMEAGTYVPRHVYVESAGSFSSPWLTDARYLFLRDLMHAGNTSLYLQAEPPNTSSTFGRPAGWVSAFTGSGLTFTWETITGYYTAGGYVSDLANRQARYRASDTTAFRTGKPHLPDIPDVVSRNAWGHFYSDLIPHAELEARALILAHETYTGLTGIPTVPHPITALFGYPEAGPTTRPRTRIYPRDDAGRIYPPPTSLQAPGRLTGYR